MARILEWELGLTEIFHQVENLTGSDRITFDTTIIGIYGFQARREKSKGKKWIMSLSESCTNGRIEDSQTSFV